MIYITYKELTPSIYIHICKSDILFSRYTLPIRNWHAFSLLISSSMLLIYITYKELTLFSFPSRSFSVLSWYTLPIRNWHISTRLLTLITTWYTLPIRNWHDILGTMSVYISMRNIVITGDFSIYRILIG